MKLILATFLGLSAVFSGLTFFKPSINSATTPVVSNSDTFTIPSSTVNTPALTNSLSSTNKTIERLSVNPARVLYLNEQVTFQAVTRLVNQLKALNAKSSDPVFLLLDSPGGSVLDGATLISEMEASKAPVYTVCTRLCASMAAMIHSYGSKRYSSDRAILMYHPASGGAAGQVPNMLSQLTTINKYIERMVSHLVGHTRMTADEFAKHVAYEFWVESEDAVALGLDDGIVNLNVPSYEQPAKADLIPPEEQKQESVVVNFQWISPHLGLWKRNAR